MPTPMLKYNRALDYMALAAKSMVDGDEVLAARLFAKAAKQDDLQAAINTIEATNRVAFAQLEAANKAAVEAATKPAPKTTTANAKPAPAAASKPTATKPVSASTRIKASEEMVEEESEFPTEDVTEEVPMEAADDEFGGDPLDDVVEEEEEEAPVEPVVAGKRMAEVLSSMKKKRDGN